MPGHGCLLICTAVSQGSQQAQHSYVLLPVKTESSPWTFKIPECLLLERLSESLFIIVVCYILITRAHVLWFSATAVVGSSVSPVHKVISMMLCIWHRSCFMPLHHRLWNRSKKVIPVTFSPFLFPYWINSSDRLLLFSFSNGHVPKDIWIKLEKFLLGAKVTNPHHMITAWFCPSKTLDFPYAIACQSSLDAVIKQIIFC